MRLKSKKLIPYKGKVYDLAVDSEDHTYNVDGFVVHNSAAGSLLTYCLNITEVDPIKHFLFFERFLNEARKDIPDIDVDYEPEGREKIKAHIIGKYGDDYTCSIGTYGTFKTRAVISDLCRVWNVPIYFGKEVSDKIFGNIDELETREDVEKMFGKELAPLKQIEPQKFFGSYINFYDEVFWKIRFKIKNLGAHAAGFIISKVPLSENLPVATRDGTRLSTWIEGKRAELSAAGFVKFDILGLLNLTFINETLKLIKLHKGIEISTQQIDSNLDDPKVYEDIKTGHSSLIFQFESSMMMELLRKANTDSFECMCAISALGRPGPIMSGLTEIFCKRKKGEVKFEYDHPILEKILGYSYGVIIYQEQIMQIVNQLAGFTLQETDIVRKNLMKLKKGTRGEQLKKLEEYKSRFIDGGKKYLSEEKLDKMFEDFKQWASYGFNRCVAGGTIIYNASGNQHQGREITIKQLFDKKHSDGWTGSKYRAGGLPKILAMVNGKVKVDKIKDVYFNGIQDVYEICDDVGNKIKATLTHRFLAQDGWRLVSDFKVGDLIGTMGNYIQHEKKAKEDYVKWGKKTYNSHGMPGFQSNEGNPYFIDGRTILYDENRKIKLSLKKCEICGNEHHRLETHHKQLLPFFNNDYVKYNTIDNLIALCPSCHKKEHYKNGRVKRHEKGRNIVFNKIISITYVGKEETYDLEMEGQEHNFVANKFISHNSHSVAYTYISYRCAWLKTYYPLEYLCSVLRNVSKGEQGMGSKKGNKYEKYIIEGKRLKIDILPIHINHSKENFVIEGDSIRLGFGNVKGIGEEPALEIAQNQPYSSYDDFINKTVEHDKSTVSKKVMVPLILTGAFEEFCPMIEAIVKYYIIRKINLEMEYKKLLDKTDHISEKLCVVFKEITKNFTLDNKHLDLSNLTDYEFTEDDKEKFFEHEFGFRLNEKLAEKVQEYWKYIPNYTGIENLKSGFCVGSIKSAYPSKEKKIYFLQLEDGNLEKNLIKVIIWPNIFKKYEDILKKNNIIVASLKFNSRFNAFEPYGVCFSDIKNISKIDRLLTDLITTRLKWSNKNEDKIYLANLTQEMEVGKVAEAFVCYGRHETIWKRGKKDSELEEDIIGRKISVFDEHGEMSCKLWYEKARKFMEEMKRGDILRISVSRDEDFNGKASYTIQDYKKYVV